MAQHLVAAGETVFEVTSIMLDARAVAVFARREASTLPVVSKEDCSAILALLTTERRAALGEGTRIGNQIHALLMQLDPEYHEKIRNIRSKTGLNALEFYTSPGGPRIQDERAAAVRRLAVRLRLVIAQAEELAFKIESCAQEAGYAPLTQICGVNLLTAGRTRGVIGSRAFPLLAAISCAAAAFNRLRVTTAGI